MASTVEHDADSSVQHIRLPASDAVEEEFHRGLKERHIQMIAIGGAIGVGLFLGSAKAIQQAGPSLLLSYAVAGVVIFFIMRALGELLMYRPVSGSYATYADEFVGPWAGFTTAWTYWLMWVVIGMAEITAAGIYVQYWLPGVPQWIPALVALVVLLGVNLVAVSVFGEFEFWFAIIKVVTILGMILIGLAIILFGVSALSDSAGFSNLWSHGGFFPKGLGGPFLAIQIVMFAFLGVELIGVTAGEAQNPEQDDPLGDQQGDLADPDLLHRRPDHHHVAGRLEPARPQGEPVRGGVRPRRHPRCRRDRQLRRADRGAVVMQ